MSPGACGNTARRAGRGIRFERRRDAGRTHALAVSQGNRIWFHHGATSRV